MPYEHALAKFKSRQGSLHTKYPIRAQRTLHRPPLERKTQWVLLPYEQAVAGRCTVFD